MWVMSLSTTHATGNMNKPTANMNKPHSTATPQPLHRHSHRAGEAVQDVQKKRTRGEREGVGNTNTQNTQISLNKQKLGEPSVCLKPVEQILYSATVPIKKSG